MGLCFVLPSNANLAEGDCEVVDKNNRTSSLTVNAASGNYSSLYFSCSLDTPTVLHFPLYYNDQFTLTSSNDVEISSLTSPQRAFLIPQGRSNLVLSSVNGLPMKLQIELTAVDVFSRNNSLAIVFSLISTGFFLAMGIQISLIGRRLKLRDMHFYPLYLIVVMLFFFFQEGINNVIAPTWTAFNDFSVRGSLGAFSVFACYLFISSVLRFREVLSRVHQNALNLFATVVAVVGIVQLFMPLEEGRLLSNVVSYSSLVLLVLAIIGNVIAIKKKVVASQIILAGILALFLTMSLRIYTYDIFPIVSRYSLIIGVMIESVFFSVAISYQVKKIRSQWVQARYESHMDSLCPVLNRRGWFEYAQEMLQEHKQQGGFLSVVYIDLDDFKKANDTHGHKVGDELLLMTTRIIEHQTRKGDIIARIGGDEFVVMSHTQDRNKSESIISRLQDKFTDLTVNLNGLTVPLNASVGGKVFSVPQDDLDKALHEVDQLMYSEKRKRQTLHG